MERENRKEAAREGIKETDVVGGVMKTRKQVNPIYAQQAQSETVVKDDKVAMGRSWQWECDDVETEIRENEGNTVLRRPANK